jgi:hypothetical protein
LRMTWDKSRFVFFTECGTLILDRMHGLQMKRRQSR